MFIFAGLLFGIGLISAIVIFAFNLRLPYVLV